MKVVTLKWVRDKFHLSETELAQHLGIREYDLQRYERGNLEVPEPVMRLAALLASLWENDMYWEPEGWGAEWD